MNNIHIRFELYMTEAIKKIKNFVKKATTAHIRMVKETIPFVCKPTYHRAKVIYQVK